MFLLEPQIVRSVERGFAFELGSQNIQVHMEKDGEASGWTLIGKGTLLYRGKKPRT